MVQKYAWILQIAALLPIGNASRLAVEEEILQRMAAPEGDEEEPANEWRPRAKALDRRWRA